MACKKLGYKPDIFRLDGQSWHCSTGLPSDVIIEVGEISFHLHKNREDLVACVGCIADSFDVSLKPLEIALPHIEFPLLSRSGLLENLIGEISWEEERISVLQLHDVPGGASAFVILAKFCYGVKIEINASNIVSLRCAAEYLQMTEEYGEGNLITQTDNFLNEIFGNWIDSIKVLETCEVVLPYAEELHIVSRSIESLAKNACPDPSLFSWPVSGQSTVQSPESTAFWNGICTTTKPLPIGVDWWYEDVSSLKLPLYKRFIQVVESRGMISKRIAGSVIHYAKCHIYLLGRQSVFRNGKLANPKLVLSPASEVDQRNLLEEIVELLPNEKGVAPTDFLLRLLRTSVALHASSSCQCKLEKQIGAQLDQALLEDLLIPNMGHSSETLYDIDRVQRILDYFMLVDGDTTDCVSSCFANDDQVKRESHSLTAITMVANLVDGYLAEVAPDVNLKLENFQSLAAVIPEYARPLDDGIYRAIDIYLKAHPWLTDSEREQICKLMSCQKLSLEASTHAAQNERLPLRVIVQVIFFEQLRLRTSIAGWFFVSENLENSQNHSANVALARNEVSTQAESGPDQFVSVENMKGKVAELEMECLAMKAEIEKIGKTKGGWNTILKKLRFRLKAKFDDVKVSKICDDNTKESPSSITPPVSESKNHATEELHG